ncbi:MAG: CHASE2 domain-containing protein [Pirellulaceae bacterium]|nr:CHASE2 domain-containing protein [Pirellulaceae bacterium]
MKNATRDSADLATSATTNYEPNRPQENMGYQVTQFLFVFRKLSRDEDQPGNLRKMIVAMAVSLALVWGWNRISIDGKCIRDYEEPLLLQALFNIRGDANPPSELAIVKVDDLSYQKLNVSNRKPFPRAILADALKEIHKDKPKVVVLDMHAPYDIDEEEGTQKAIEALRLGPTTIARAPVSDDASYASDPRIQELPRWNFRWSSTTTSELATTSDSPTLKTCP